MAYPRSPYDKEGGLVYFTRMLDKIRLKRRKELPEEYFPPQGRGFDGNCCQFLGVRFDDVVLKVQEGLSNPEILKWCFKAGGPKSDFDILLWNSLASKKGWGKRKGKRGQVSSWLHKGNSDYFARLVFHEIVTSPFRILS